MTTQIEVLAGLERRLTLSVATATIQQETRARLAQIAKTMRVPGFRPGKVPIKMVEQSHGQQISSEVLGDAVSKAFSAAVADHGVKVAGEPRIEPVMPPEGGATGEFHFSASFEIFPEFTAPSPVGQTFTRFASPVGDAEVDRTLETLRRQRVQWVAADRPAQDADRVTIDFRGSQDGVEFAGGSAENFPFVLGEGKMLADFETGVRGASVGEQRTFTVNFPEDYQNADLAGKPAQFEITLRQVEEPVLPEINAEFAVQFGIADGDLGRMRADVRANLEREVGQRLRTRTKTQIMDRLTQLAEFELPVALVRSEAARMVESAQAELKQRGIDTAQMPVPPDAFQEQAQKRVRLGLIIGELVRVNKLQARPDQIRRQIEEFAQAYENPGELIRWYYSDRERLADVEALVVEQNVVDWVLEQGQTEEVTLGFDELMGANA